MENSAGLIPKSRVSVALSKQIGETSYFLFFPSFQAEKCWKGLLNGGKSVEGSKRKNSKASVEFFTGADEKFATGWYSVQQFPQVVSRNKIFLEKWDM